MGELRFYLSLSHRNQWGKEAFSFDSIMPQSLGLKQGHDSYFCPTTSATFNTLPTPLPTTKGKLECTVLTIESLGGPQTQNKITVHNPLSEHSILIQIISERLKIYQA